MISEKLTKQSNTIVPSQYGIILQPITFRAYFNLSSLSYTGCPAILADEMHIPNDNYKVNKKAYTTRNSSFCLKM